MSDLSLPNRLIGRELVLRQAQAKLGNVRLLTLTGPGGIGKTRLSLEIGASFQASGRSVTFVDLSSLHESTHVLLTIASTLGVRGDSAAPLADRIASVLCQAPHLLILDNFEQVYAAAGDVVALLERCPSLQILVTSRIALRVPDEHELPLPPLELPVGDVTSDHLAEVPAVALFVERAHAARADFALSDVNSQAVAEICARLDGLPLAIELAAARVRVLPPQAMAARLDRAFAFIGEGLSERPARQRGLRAVVDWSYDLLDVPTRAVYERLGVFAGTFSLEAVESVAGAAGEASAMLDWLSLLVEFNLLRQADLDAPDARFRMLETIREHAIERLTARGELDATQRRHCAFYTAIAEASEQHLTGPRSQEWLACIDRERGNLRAAMRWAVDAGEAEAAHRVAGGLWRFWFNRAEFLEGAAWLEQALALDGASYAARAKTLIGAGNMAARLGRSLRAASFFEEALALARAAGDQFNIAYGLNSLGNVAYDRGARTEAAALYSESLAVRRSIGDLRGVSVTLNNLGNVAFADADYDTAAQAYAESIDLRRELGDKHGLGTSLNNLAHLETLRGNPDRVAALAAEGLAIAQALGDRWGIGEALLVLAELASGQGRNERGVRLLGAAEALRESVGFDRRPDEEARFQRLLGTVGSKLSDAAFESCWAAGRGLSLGEAVRLALAADLPPVLRAPPSQTGSPMLVGSGELGNLTDREREVLVLLARGRSNRQIAEDLVISENTTAVHVKHILRKLDCASRAQAAVWAVQRGLVPATAA